MPRQARLLIPGLPLHLIQRGHNRQPCFHQVGDYLFFLDWLKQYASKMGVSLHAYVLMTNHVHLLASFDDIAFTGKFMKALGQRYAEYANRRQQRSGSAWEGRYRSSPVPTDRYLITCQRYIELNPVRAGMVQGVDEYPWSSFAGNAGLRQDDALTPHPLFSSLGKTDSARATAYQKLFEAPPCSSDIDALRKAANSNRLPGAVAPKPGRPAVRSASIAAAP